MKIDAVEMSVLRAECQCKVIVACNKVAVSNRVAAVVKCWVQKGTCHWSVCLHHKAVCGSA